jgi:hypothetical protein
MMLWDGSPHRWFGPDQPECSLMAAVDDVTGTGYLWLPLWLTTTRFACPAKRIAVGINATPDCQTCKQ